MARTTTERKAIRSLVWLLVIIIALIAANGASVLFNNGQWTPKLALDLEGGTQITLSPQLSTGEAVTPEQLERAVAIIRQRVDASGVSEAEINTQGNQNIVVSIPGEPDDETRERIQSSAKLEFRPVLAADLPSPDMIGEEGAEDPATDPSASPSAEPSAAPSPTASPTDASDLAWITPELQEQFDTFDCASLSAVGANVAPTDEPLITCEQDGSIKYILGPVEVAGERIADARAGLVTSSTGVTTNEWGVFMEFDAEGTAQFRAVTERLVALVGVQNQFAIVLDGSVISAPRTISAITDGRPQISGNFTEESALTLADQLKFGA
ncbi:MAG: protein translocase subunit SecD, partial [Micrococcales bacterium 32-70-13]